MIVRVTNRCNFKCDFCSASKLSKNVDLPIETLYQLLDRYHSKIQSLIFEGGDPLCRSPQFYYDIFAYIEKNHYDIPEIGFTTNLWDFYKRPEKWTDILSLPNVSVCTSFQYGNRRKLTDDVVLTEKLFVEIYTKFQQLINKPLNFISVIDYDNCDQAVATVRLAKSLDCNCRLNPALPYGRQHKVFPFDHMMKLWRDIIINDLGQYEDNCAQIIKLLQHEPTENCPWIANCKGHFLCVTPDGLVSNCSMENSSVYERAKNNSIIWLNNIDDAIVQRAHLLSPRCAACKYYNICNNCAVQTKFNRPLYSMEFCDNIKNALHDIENYLENSYHWPTP